MKEYIYIYNFDIFNKIEYLIRPYDIDDKLKDIDNKNITIPQKIKDYDDKYETIKFYFAYLQYLTNIILKEKKEDYINSKERGELINTSLKFRLLPIIIVFIDVLLIHIFIKNEIDKLKDRLNNELKISLNAFVNIDKEIQTTSIGIEGLTDTGRDKKINVKTNYIQYNSDKQHINRLLKKIENLKNYLDYNYLNILEDLPNYIILKRDVYYNSIKNLPTILGIKNQNNVYNVYNSYIKTFNETQILPITEFENNLNELLNEIKKLDFIKFTCDNIDNIFSKDKDTYKEQFFNIIRKFFNPDLFSQDDLDNLKQHITTIYTNIDGISSVQCNLDNFINQYYINSDRISKAKRKLLNFAKKKYEERAANVRAVKERATEELAANEQDPGKEEEEKEEEGVVVGEGEGEKEEEAEAAKAATPVKEDKKSKEDKKDDSKEKKKKEEGVRKEVGDNGKGEVSQEELDEIDYGLDLEMSGKDWADQERERKKRERIEMEMNKEKERKRMERIRIEMERVLNEN